MVFSFQGNTTVANTSAEIDRNDDFEDVENENENDEPTESPTAFSTTATTTYRPFNNATVRATVPTTTIRPTKLDELTIQRQKAAEQKLKPNRITQNDLSADESSSTGVSVIETTLCDCPEIEVTSKVKYHYNCKTNANQKKLPLCLLVKKIVSFQLL